MLPYFEGYSLLFSVTVPIRYSQVPSHMLYKEGCCRPIKNSTQRNRWEEKDDKVGNNDM